MKIILASSGVGSVRDTSHSTESRPQAALVDQCELALRLVHEWQAVTRNGKALKQPWYIRPTEEHAYFAMAGLLAKWVAPDGSNLITACVITTEPNGVMTPIHDRMPVILSENDIGTWLDPGNHDRSVLTPMLKSAADETMKAIPVSLSVNRASNDGPELIQAIELPE